MLDAATIAGALADDNRRRAFAAVQLGATSLDAVVAASGLSRVEATTAVGRLASIGLVVSGDDGTLTVLGAAFAQAARQALHRPRSTEHAKVDPAKRAVFEAFVRDGQIVSTPASHGKRLVLLDWLAQDFEPGHRYSEQRVNAVLAKRHPDTAMWRRYLVDDGFLDRRDGVYWRSGGTVGGGAVTGAW